MNTTENINSLTSNDRFNVELLLEKTYRHNLYHNKFLEKNMTVHQFRGQIGDQFFFNGKFFIPANGNVKKSWAEINYHNQNQNLTKIITEHGFIAPGSMPFWTDKQGLIWDEDWLNNNIKAIDDATTIKVFSPRYNEKDGVSETYYNEKKLRKLSVYHAPYENAKDVLANIFKTLDYSKDHNEVKNKLTQLNLPSNIKIKNIDALADIITDKIYHDQQSDREM